MGSAFHNLHLQGFVRVAVATPPVSLADPTANAKATIAMAQAADAKAASVVLFPELGLSGYSIDDLLQQSVLQSAVLVAIEEIRISSRDMKAVLFVGAPQATALQ